MKNTTKFDCTSYTQLPLELQPLMRRADEIHSGMEMAGYRPPWALGEVCSRSYETRYANLEKAVRGLLRVIPDGYAESREYRRARQEAYSALKHGREA